MNRNRGSREVSDNEARIRQQCVEALWEIKGLYEAGYSDEVLVDVIVRVVDEAVRDAIEGVEG